MSSFPFQFFVLQISLNVSLFHACCAWERSFLMFSFNIFAGNWCAAAQNWTTCTCFTFDRWVVTCSETEKSKQFLIPLDTQKYYSKCAKWFEVSYRSCSKRRHLFFCFGFHSNYFRWQDSYYLIFYCFIVFILGLPRRLLCCENREFII